MNATVVSTGFATIGRNTLQSGIGLHLSSSSSRTRLVTTFAQHKLNLASENDDENRPEMRSRMRRLRARMRLWKYYLKKVLLRTSLVNLVNKKNWKKLLAGGILGCMVAVAIVVYRLTATVAPMLVPYSDLVVALETKMVRSVLFEEGSPQVFFNLVTKERNVAAPPVASSPWNFMKLQRPDPAWEYCTRKISQDEPYLLNILRDQRLLYFSAPKSLGATLGTVVATIVTLWIPLAPMLWLMHRQMNGASSLAKKQRKPVELVRFEDVAGVDSAKAELWEIVSCLKGRSNFRSLGAKFPKGVLLIGPPGTGKTLLARALAGEAGVPFFATSASEFVEMFVGRGAARVRELFSTARKCAPSVVFIDELDAVGGQRGRGFTDERDQTLNQLLTEMDGFGSETGVLVLAATNRAEVLDPALCRPGRFSRKVYVREPDFEGRMQVLAVHMRNVRIEGDAQGITRVIAAMTPGFAGADLANVVNEAALLAARKEQAFVTLENFKDAVYRARHGIGQEPSLWSGFENKVCSLLKAVVPVNHRADGGGYQATM